MRITAIETVVPDAKSFLPALVFVRVHTDEGIVGHGETYYTPRAVSSFVHEFLAPLLLGEDPLAPERHWERCYRTAAHFGGGRGLELRSLSAIDLALWDIVSQAAQLPLYRVLGGPTAAAVPAYNTCGGPAYGRGRGPGYGDATKVGQLDDLAGFLERPGELALELVDEGFVGMKIWPFDQIAQEFGGMTITVDQMNHGIRPFAAIRDAVGTRIEVMAEGHGFWSLPAAKKIARALEPFEPAWIEDFILADQPAALLELKRSTTIPLLASEYLMSRFDYAPLIQSGAIDYVMIDPTWAGGITESRRIVALADTARLPVTFHDCTGPFTLLAGVHLALSSPNTLYQEVVRAYLRVVYPDFVGTGFLTLEHGRILAPEAIGVGATLRPDVATRPGAEQRWSRVDV